MAAAIHLRVRLPLPENIAICIRLSLTQEAEMSSVNSEIARRIGLAGFDDSLFYPPT